MLLQLDQISDKTVVELAQSFGNLPETSHLDGKYRLRRYSTVQCNGNCIEIGDNTFTQSDEYNKFQGNVTRNFEAIEESVIKSVGMVEMCRMFKNICGFPENQEINIHQMRIITLDEETPVSPEGIHQDGYDYICIVGISRYNVDGGNLLLYKQQNSDPFFSVPLHPGLAAIINDRVLWHNASKIKPVIGVSGFIDSFILTASRRNGEQEDVCSTNGYGRTQREC